MIMGRTCSGVSALNLRRPAASAILAKSGLCRSVPKSGMPDAFISSSTKASASFRKTTILTGSCRRESRSPMPMA